MNFDSSELLKPNNNNLASVKCLSFHFFYTDFFIGRDRNARNIMRKLSFNTLRSEWNFWGCWCLWFSLITTANPQQDIAIIPLEHRQFNTFTPCQMHKNMCVGHEWNQHCSLAGPCWCEVVPRRYLASKTFARQCSCP